MKVKVVVTQENIDLGVPSDPCHCPVANALKCAGFQDVDVQPSHAIIWDARTRRIYQLNLPVYVTNHIFDFDDFNGMEPFEFEVEAVEP